MWQSDHYYVGSGHGLPHHLCAVKNSVFWNHISCIFLALQWHNEHETPRSNRGNFIFLISSLSDCAALSGNARRETDSSDSRRGPPWTRVCDASFQPCRKHEAFRPEHSRRPPNTRGLFRWSFSAVPTLWTKNWQGKLAGRKRTRFQWVLLNKPKGCSRSSCETIENFLQLRKILAQKLHTGQIKHAS